MIYSHFGHPGNTVAKTAYFLSNSGRFLMEASLGLANEQLVPPKENSHLSDEQLLAHYKRALDIRLEQIEAGKIDFRVHKGYNEHLDESDENPFKPQFPTETHFDLEKEPFKYDNFTFILPDAYRYV